MRANDYVVGRVGDTGARVTKCHLYFMNKKLFGFSSLPSPITVRKIIFVVATVKELNITGLTSAGQLT